jgi:23S rRNA (cytidine1920-2'-O)/16S rRNA (cytidine1409-2'-O)-methyltransferase
VKKERLDVLLVSKGYFESRQQAQRAILAGLVYVDQQRAEKAGMKVPESAQIEVKGQLHPYVSRGGLKLEKAIRRFQLSLADKIVMDVGASTGGFTDCALQHGAKQVYAIDVGYGQLAWKLRQDPRVVVMERTNFRYLKPEDLTGETPNFVTIDVSFISLALILPVVREIVHTGAEVVALVKPQFEAGREQVGKKGLVKDPAVHRQVLHNFVKTAQENGFAVQGITVSPIQGGEGNIEFLSYLVLDGQSERKDWSKEIDKIVEEAHRQFSP